jgi:DNA-binding SARP family transcriptional activator/Cdc6-like AAA superfamily ATPase
MADLKLRVLGDLEVVRDGTVLDLPPSKKTRGLLAYLALNTRSMRREQLCELLWEIPDDPRGSLRWSLSKLRKLVDDDDHPRIIADRNTVSFDTSDVVIDVTALHAAAGGNLHGTPTELLQAAADACQGCFLEGLELPNFHDFYTWCLGERERANRSQAALLRELLDRFAGEPAQALTYANRLVALLPFDETSRAALIQLLVRLDRMQEAEQQYRVGVQRLEEVGSTDSGALYRALHVKSPSASQPGHYGTAGQPRQAPAAPVASADSSLVGRDGEVALISGLIAALPAANSAQVVLIRGEPGMGKSRLLQAAAALAREAGAGLLKASAFESEMIRPFAVWNDALRRALPDNETSALLASGERVSRDAVFKSLSDVLCQETAKHPVVVICDDVQWCDESSVSAMNHIMRMNRRQPLLVVAATRETELRDNPAVQQVLRSLRHDKLLREIRLDPLTEEQLCELISLNAPGANAEGLSRECAGNPLLALELARAELEGGGANSLSELVQDRLSRLDEDAETVLLWAAVVSPRINISFLEQVTGLELAVIESALEAAERQGMLHPGERGLRFSHDMIARSIYQQISPARLQVMHRRAAELLEVDANMDLALAADLSHHARRSGDPALAGRAMVSAGKLCLRFYANEDALDLYHRGLEFAAQLSEADRVRLTIELGEIRLNAVQEDDWEAQVSEYVQLAEQALDHGASTHARLGYQMASYVRWDHGQWSEAQRFSLQAERVARGATDEDHILGMAEAAKCLALLERDLSQADAMAMEASALAGRVSFQCPALPISQGILRYYENRLDDAVEHLEVARTLSKTEGDRITEYMANEYLTLVEVEREDYDAALERCQALVEIGSRLREGSERPFSLALQALCHYGLHREDSGLDDALQELRLMDAKQRLAYILNRAAMLDIVHERLEQGKARASEALALSQTMERPSEMLQAYINLEKIYLRDEVIAGSSPRSAIEQLATGTVAGWVRKRANALLSGEE